MDPFEIPPDAEAEITRTENAIDRWVGLMGFNGTVVCGCGRELCGGVLIPFLILPGCCVECFYKDHPELRDCDPVDLPGEIIPF
jgi:hypothetical protein